MLHTLELKDQQLQLQQQQEQRRTEEERLGREEADSAQAQQEVTVLTISQYCFLIYT